VGNSQCDSENVVSYELGYRTTWIDNVSIDLTASYNSYTNLASITLNNPSFDPEQGVLHLSSSFENNKKSKTYGFEIATVWQMLDWWRWDANYSLLKMDIEEDGISQDSVSPQQRVSLRSSLSPWQNINIDFIFRYVDENRAVNFSGNNDVDDYASLDIRLAWQPINNLELSLVGQNLLADQHLEYIQEAFTSPTEIDRGVYGKLVWQF
jgi:iron complex outermembrane receptor protein